MGISREQLREMLQAALAAARASPPHPARSFWAHNPEQNFPPPSKRSPDDYNGEGALSISCTQTELPAAKQRALVRSWCDFLPRLRDVRFVWFHSKVTQELFDAACQLPGLEGLYVSWSGIQSLAALSRNKDLHFLKLGSSPGIGDIAPLAKLGQLEWLELDNLKLIDDLGPVSGLTRLEGFAFTGAQGKAICVNSFEPVARLSELRWLHLAMTTNPALDLRPLAALRKLRWLGLSNRFPMEEFAWLSARLPASVSPWLRPGDDLGRIDIKCKTCKTGKVMLSGKGKGIICPSCMSSKWTAHQVAFAKAARA